MAEVTRSSHSGEMQAQFIEFVMMQAQNASLFLGLIPNPQSGKAEVNLQLARLFIDQLTMIQEKTRNNLSSDEQKVLGNALSNLQMAFVEASQQPGGGSSFATESIEETAVAAEESAPTDSSATPPPEESRKRFSKSYGG